MIWAGAIRRGRKPHLLRDERGSVTIEFVVMLPLLLAAMGLAFEFGQLFLAHNNTVNNVRDAARYLSRSQLTDTQMTTADSIVRTGLPSGGTAPAYLDTATVEIDPDYDSFGDTNFRVATDIVRVRVAVDYPLTIFDFAVEGHTTIPFVVRDDVRHYGN